MDLVNLKHRLRRSILVAPSCITLLLCIAQYPMARTEQHGVVSPSEHKKRKRRGDEARTELTKPPKHKKVKSQTMNSVDGKSAQAFNDTAATDMDSDQLAEHFAKCIVEQFDGITPIELEDKSLPPKAFYDTSSFTEPRLAENMTQFLDKFTSGGAKELQRCDKVSSPHTLIIASAATRAQVLIRAVRSYGSEDNKIAKLFAKHMKLPESIDYVQKTKFGIGVGTPHRIKELVEKSVLKTDDLKRIVLDVSFVDEKKRTIMSQKDVFVALLELLNLDAIKLRLVRGDTQLQVF